MYFAEIVVLPAILFSAKIKVATRKTAIYSTVRVHFRKFRWQSNVFCITLVSIKSLEPDIAVISRICGHILNRFAPWVQPYFGGHAPLEKPRNIYQSMLQLAWLTITQHVFQPALTCRLELISWKIVSCEPGTKAIAVSRFCEKNCLPWIGSKELPRFCEKYKNGVQHATTIYPIPPYIWPWYIGSALYWVTSSYFDSDSMAMYSGPRPASNLSQTFCVPALESKEGLRSHGLNVWLGWCWPTRHRCIESWSSTEPSAANPIESDKDSTLI